jgi:hypothetical protein
MNYGIESTTKGRFTLVFASFFEIGRRPLLENLECNEPKVFICVCKVLKVFTWDCRCLEAFTGVCKDSMVSSVR